MVHRCIFHTRVKNRAIITMLYPQFGGGPGGFPGGFPSFGGGASNANAAAGTQSFQGGPGGFNANSANAAANAGTSTVSR